MQKRVITVCVPLCVCAAALSLYLILGFKTEPHIKSDETSFDAYENYEIETEDYFDDVNGSFCVEDPYKAAEIRMNGKLVKAYTDKEDIPQVNLIFSEFSRVFRYGVADAGGSSANSTQTDGNYAQNADTAEKAEYNVTIIAPDGSKEEFFLTEEKLTYGDLEFVMDLTKEEFLELLAVLEIG